MQQLSRRQKLYIILGLIGSTVLVVVLYFLITPAYTKVSAYKTPFQDSTHSAISGDSIYSYSGMSFYKTNLKNPSKLTVLSSGLRLPTVERAYWGNDEGVLLTFTDGGYNGSVVEKILSANGKVFDETTQKYLWYLNFKTGALNIISESGIQDGAVYYASVDNLFYYVEEAGLLPESDIPIEASLFRFNPSSMQKGRIAGVGVNNPVTAVTGCGENATICLVMSQEGRENVLQISSDGKAEYVTTEPFDSIILTGSNLFLGIKKHPAGFSHTDDVVLRGDIYGINPGDKTIRDLGNEVSMSSAIIANATDPDSFYIFDPNALEGDKPSYLSAKKNAFGQLRLGRKTVETPHDKSLQLQTTIPPVSRNSEGYVMFYDVDGYALLLTNNNTDYKSSQKDAGSVQTELESCLNRYATDYLYSDELKQFKLDIVYDDSFASKIKGFSDCVNTEAPLSLIGYTFVFVGVSPVDGRYVTD